MIAVTAILGLIFVPSPYANCYHVPKSAVKSGITVDANVKRNDKCIARHYTKVHKGQALELTVEQDVLFAKHYHGNKINRESYDRSNKVFSLNFKSN